MPELPEVETSRRDLEREVVGHRIERVLVMKTQKLRGQSPEEIQVRLQGQMIQSVGRRGKFLYLNLGSQDSLIIHRGMTGNFRLAHPSERVDSHLHLLLGLENERELRLIDPRGFGEVRVVSPEAFQERFQRLGRDPLEPDFTVEYLLGRFRHRAAPIKALLLSQDIIAGLGNIYVDETLWAARIHPLRRAGELSHHEVERLHDEIRRILPASIARGGVTFSDALDLYGNRGTYGSLLNAFQRDGEPCSRCLGQLETTRVAGRGTSFCPACQTLPPRP